MNIFRKPVLHLWLTTLIGFSILPAIAQSNLVYNGNFGSTNPSVNGWLLNEGQPNLRKQSIPNGCTQYRCGGGFTLNWACVPGNNNVKELQQISIPGLLKPETRYRISFDAFKDITGLPSNDQARSLTGHLSVNLADGNRHYTTKDFLVTPLEFGKYSTLSNLPLSMEFVTPAALSPNNMPNIGNRVSLSFSMGGTGSENRGDFCLTRIKLHEVDEPNQAASRVVVNTYGYAATGSKIATLVMPANANPQGFSWRLKYGNGIPTFTYNVRVSFYAVVTDNQGQPVKDANGHYQLQRNPDNSYKIVGGFGTGGNGNYAPPNGGVIPANALSHDPDSGESVYTIDFSGYGVPTSNPMVVPHGAGSASPYTAPDGKSYYVISASSYQSSYSVFDSPNSLGYYIEIRDASNQVVLTSPTFSIKWNPFQALKQDALHTFYHQRSGEFINPSRGVGLKHENFLRHQNAGHEYETADCFSGQDLHGNNWGNANTLPSFCRHVDVSGGWYDAADHGKYVVNGAVTLWALQNMIERLQQKGSLNQAFPPGGLGIPETRGGAYSDGHLLPNLSDLMREARVEMAWLLKMQVPANSYMKVPVGNQAIKQSAANGIWGQSSPNPGVYQIKLWPVTVTINNANYTINQETAASPDLAGDIDFAGGKLPRLRLKLNLTEENVGGMVFSAVHDQSWTGIPTDPSTYNASTKNYNGQPTGSNPRVLIYPTTAATLSFAAVAAQCSRIWRNIDPAFANRCLTAAEEAWDAAERFASRKHILRYEYTNTSDSLTATNSSWSSADPGKATGKNRAILQYGFALNPMFAGGGAYGDLRVDDEYLWASKELRLATGRNFSVTGRLVDCSISSLQCYNWVTGFDWQNISPLGHLSEWTAEKNATAGTRIRAAADGLANYATKGHTQAQGYLFAKKKYSASDRNTHAEWGDNGAILNRSLILLTAHDVALDGIAPANHTHCAYFASTGGRNNNVTAGNIHPNWIPAPGIDEQNRCTAAHKYLNAAVNSLGYLLGRNSVGRSYISGYGSHDFTSAHHRWFANAADATYPTLPRAYVAGGPNTRDLPALRANASRYTFNDMLKWIGENNKEPTRAAVGWDVGDINDKGQEYLETMIVPRCTRGLGIADARWSMPNSVVASPSNPASYTPQKCYRDHYKSFATNEIAINWQSPLVWVSQYLSEIYR